MGHPSGRPGLRPHIRLLRASQHSCATNPLLPAQGISDPSEGAGLTSKPHRDQSTISRLTWAVSPAAGIGFPRPPLRVPSRVPGATTDPDGCHIMTVILLGPAVKYRGAGC